MSVVKFQEQLIEMIVKYYQDYNIYNKLEHYHKHQALVEASHKFLSKSQKKKLQDKLNRIHPLKQHNDKSSESNEPSTWENTSTLRKIKAKYSGKCYETGNVIEKQETCLFEISNRNVYCKDSSTYRNWKKKKRKPLF